MDIIIFFIRFPIIFMAVKWYSRPIKKLFYVLKFYTDSFKTKSQIFLETDRRTESRPV